MNRDYSRFYSLTSILAGTVTVAGIVVFAAAPVFAKTPQEIAQLAISATVQINSQYPNGAIGSGSGFIIAKQGTTYTVLTANHVVANSQPTYKIRTYRGKQYPVTRFVLLRKSNNDPDLAVVTFNSTESYPVVTLGDSEQAVIGTEIFVAGYPANIAQEKYGTNRNFEFSTGFTTSRPVEQTLGYNFRYTAVTKGGMSGGPVFDREGRVVGVHGWGDRDDDEVKDSRGYPTGKVSTNTGFNAAIPINDFLAKLSQTGLNRSALLLNTSTATNAPLKLNNPNDAKTYYVRGLSRFDKGDLSGAVADFNQAIQTQSDYSEAYLALLN